MVSTWRSVGPRGNDPQRLPRGADLVRAWEEGPRRKGKSQYQEKRDPRRGEWGPEETPKGKGPPCKSSELRRPAAERAPCRSRLAARGGAEVLSGPRGWGLLSGRPGKGRRGRGGTRGTGPGSGGGRRPGGLGRRGPAPPGAPSLPRVPRHVHARAGWAEQGAGRGEGGAPAQQLPPPSRRPQTFTKRRVRPHQSPLIIVGWAAGGGRGSRAGRPGRWERALRRERSRARQRRAEGGSEA